MSLSSKFLSPEDLSNGLDIVGQSSLRFNNSKAGLQSDMPEDISESAEKLKLEIENLKRQLSYENGSSIKWVITFRGFTRFGESLPKIIDLKTNIANTRKTLN